jgi:mannobiose 2-epimerase
MRIRFGKTATGGFIRKAMVGSGGVALLLCLTALAGAQDPRPKAAGSKMARASETEIKQHLDRAWLKKAFLNDMMEHWLTASVMPNGFIQENLDREWKPWGTQREASLNGQGRVLYTLAAAYEVSGGDKRYLDAMTKAADFLLKMHDDEYGGYYNRVTPDLKIIDDTKGGFQSFAIFSLAHVGRVTKNQKYTKAALAAYNELKAKMPDGPFISGNFKRDFSGPAPRGAGFGGPGGRGARGRGGEGAPAGAAAPQGMPPGGGFQMTPGGHRLDVHMFEALLELYEITRSKEVWATITAQMDLMAKVYDYNLGYLSESYDANWKPTGNPNSNPGHLFEWASLLSRAVESGADPKFIELGSRNLDLGLKSYNKEVGGLGGRNASGAPSNMLWWPQCEVIKATAHYAILRGRSELWPVHQQTLDFVKKTYLDTEYGGWFEGYIPGTPRESMGARAYIKGAVDGPELSPYHMTSMFHDLWRITDPKYKPESGR